MPFFSSHPGQARGLALAGAIAAVIGASTISPAFAGDDGQAPIWSGIGSLVGLTGLTGGKDKEAPIDYRERGRLVLPPTMALPPPVPPAAERTAAWPVDPDLEKVRKAREDKLKILKSQSSLQALRNGNRVSPDTLRSERMAPGSAGAGGNCAAAALRDSTCGQVPFHNVFEAIGLAKPDEVIAGQEPDRDWLTDPPKGYRVPTTNTVATFDAKKTNNDRDPAEYMREQRENNN